MSCWRFVSFPLSIGRSRPGKISLFACRIGKHSEVIKNNHPQTTVKGLIFSFLEETKVKKQSEPNPFEYTLYRQRVNIRDASGFEKPQITLIWYLLAHQVFPYLAGTTRQSVLDTCNWVHKLPTWSHNSITQPFLKGLKCAANSRLKLVFSYSIYLAFLFIMLFSSVSCWNWGAPGTTYVVNRLYLRAVSPIMELFGLSKERPILDHHAKAHIHEIRRISYRFHLKSGGFRKTNCQEW